VFRKDASVLIPFLRKKHEYVIGIYLFIYLCSSFLSFYLFICLFVYLFICLFIIYFLCVYLCFFLFIYLSFRLLFFLACMRSPLQVSLLKYLLSKLNLSGTTNAQTNMNETNTNTTNKNKKQFYIDLTMHDNEEWMIRDNTENSRFKMPDLADVKTQRDNQKLPSAVQLAVFHFCSLICNHPTVFLVFILIFIVIFFSFLVSFLLFIYLFTCVLDKFVGKKEKTKQ
jgi:hypothetical protein